MGKSKKQAAAELDDMLSVAVIGAAALAAAEGKYEGALAIIESYDGPLVPVAFALAVLAGEAITPDPGKDYQDRVTDVVGMLKGIVDNIGMPPVG